MRTVIVADLRRLSGTKKTLVALLYIDTRRPVQFFSSSRLRFLQMGNQCFPSCPSGLGWWPKGIARSLHSILVWPNQYGLPTSAIAWRTCHYGGKNRNYSVMANYYVRELLLISSGLGRVVGGVVVQTTRLLRESVGTTIISFQDLNEKLPFSKPAGEKTESSTHIN